MSTYERGSQNISNHRETYHDIMEMFVWGGGFIAMIVLFSTMVFAAKMSWLLSLAVTMVLGIIAGIILKKGSPWIGTVIGLGIFTLILGWGISMLQNMGG